MPRLNVFVKQTLFSALLVLGCQYNNKNYLKFVRKNIKLEYNQPDR